MNHKYLTNIEIENYKKLLEHKQNLPRVDYPHYDPLFIDNKVVHLEMKTVKFTNEEFKPIRFTDGLYSVSNYGRVKYNNETRPLKVVGTFLHCTSVYIKEYGFSNVYRLVKKTFDPRDNMHELEVHHINNNALDNRLENLIWVTRQEHNKIDYLFNVELRKISCEIYKNNLTNINNFIESKGDELFSGFELLNSCKNVYRKVITDNIYGLVNKNILEMQNQNCKSHFVNQFFRKNRIFD